MPDVGFVAILRERGFFDFEKNQPESWRGGCQPTVHGGIEAGESIIEALCREITEEIGPDFAKYFDDSLKSKITKVCEDDSKDRTVTTFAAKIDFSLLKKFRLSPDSGTIRFVKKDEVDKIVSLNNFDKNIGVSDRNTIAMFTDDKEALISAFKIFS